MLNDEIKANVQQVIDVLKSIDDSKFDYDCVEHACGTPACVAGWAYWCKNKDDIFKVRSDGVLLSDSKDIWKEALEFMGYNNVNIDDFEMKMFNNQFDYSDKTKEEVITMLEHYRDTGEISWGDE